VNHTELSTGQKRVLQGLVVLVFSVLFLPGIQRWTAFADVAPLDGYAPKVPDNPELTDTGWFNGSYQKKKAGWLDENYGFRNVLMRLHNQIGYSCWNHSYTNAVIVGKDGYLFDMKYIRSWQGKDFIGSNSIETKVRKLKAVQDELERRGKTVLVVMAPGKGSFFHAFLPDEEQITPDTTNYEVYCTQLKNYGVPFIDVASWFDVLRNQTEYPLFPKCGIHWSTYGATLVADSVTSRLESETGLQLPRVIIDRVIFKDTANVIDADIGRGMNLLQEPKGFPLAYPVYHFSPSDNTKRLTALVIGDSYYWTHNPYRFLGPVYSSIDFYYYNKDYHPFGGNQTGVDTTQAWNQCLTHDVVILCCVDANLPNFGWGFVEQVYAQMCVQLSDNNPQVVSEMSSEAGANNNKHWTQSIPADVKRQMVTIYNDPKWYASVLAKAKEQNIDPDSMLYLDARYVVEEERKKKR
jgi:hypothetical protein